MKITFVTSILPAGFEEKAVNPFFLSSKHRGATIVGQSGSRAGRPGVAMSLGWLPSASGRLRIVSCRDGRSSGDGGGQSSVRGYRDSAPDFSFTRRLRSTDTYIAAPSARPFRKAATSSTSTRR